MATGIQKNRSSNHALARCNTSHDKSLPSYKPSRVQSVQESLPIAPEHTTRVDARNCTAALRNSPCGSPPQGQRSRWGCARCRAAAPGRCAGRRGRAGSEPRRRWCGRRRARRQRTRPAHRSPRPPARRGWKGTSAQTAPGALPRPSLYPPGPVAQHTCCKQHPDLSQQSILFLFARQ